MAFCSQNRRATKLRYTPRNLTEREGIEPTNLILEIKILPLNYPSFKFLNNILSIALPFYYNFFKRIIMNL